MIGRSRLAAFCGAALLLLAATSCEPSDTGTVNGQITENDAFETLDYAG